MTTRRRFLVVGQWVCAAFVVAVTTWFLWLEPPLIEYQLPFQILTTDVHAGEPVEWLLTRSVRSNRPVDIRISRELVNLTTGERTELLSTLKRRVEPNERERIARIAIPRSALAGYYRICGTVFLPGTVPIIERSVPWCTQSFHVSTPTESPANTGDEK